MSKDVPDSETLSFIVECLLKTSVKKADFNDGMEHKANLFPPDYKVSNVTGRYYYSHIQYMESDEH